MNERFSQPTPDRSNSLRIHETATECGYCCKECPGQQQMVNTQCAHCLSQWVFLAVDNAVKTTLQKEERWLDPYNRPTVSQEAIPRLARRPKLTLIQGQIETIIENLPPPEQHAQQA